MSRTAYILFDFDGVLLDSYRDRSLKHFFLQYTSRRERLPLVKGMDKVVKELADDYVLGIISGTGLETIKKFLDSHQLSDYFSTLVGYEPGTSKADKLEKVLLDHGLTPEQCVFVTDTIADIKEAHIAGVPVVAVNWGYDRVTHLLKAEPDVIVESPRDIINWLEKQALMKL
jgi:HAD superfamily hydrolase (TIGR01549 family)